MSPPTKDEERVAVVAEVFVHLFVDRLAGFVGPRLVVEPTAASPGLKEKLDLRTQPSHWSRIDLDGYRYQGQA